MFLSLKSGSRRAHFRSNQQTMASLHRKKTQWMSRPITTASCADATRSTDPMCCVKLSCEKDNFLTQSIFEFGNKIHSVESLVSEVIACGLFLLIELIELFLFLAFQLFTYAFISPDRKDIRFNIIMFKQLLFVQKRSTKSEGYFELFFTSLVANTCTWVVTQYIQSPTVASELLPWSCWGPSAPFKGNSRIVVKGMAAHNTFSQVLLTGLGIQSRFPCSEGTSLAL